MKKIIAMILVLAMSVSLAACSSSKDKASEESKESSASSAAEESSEDSSEASEEVVEEEQVAGGWTVPSEAELPDEAKEALEKASANYTGMNFTPVALLGTQVVAGVNYKIFCAATTVTAEPETQWNIVTVYKNLEGDCEITNVEVYMFNDAEAVGSYVVNENAVDAPITKEDTERFEKATKELVGASYEPVAMLGTQVVSGTNYKYLCHEALVTATPTYKWAVVTVYEDLEGNVSLGEVEDLEV